MISVYKIKPKFQQLLLPLLKFMYKLGFTANGITISAVILSLAVGILFWMFPNGVMLWILPIALLLRMMLNALDGMMAKTYKMQSQKGEILNELGDVVSDFFMFFPLVKLEGANLWVVLLFILLSILNEFIGVLMKAVTGIRRYEGPMGKSDRALVIGISCLLLFFIPGLKVITIYIFNSMSILLLISSFARIKKGLKDETDIMGAYHKEE